MKCSYCNKVILRNLTTWELLIPRKSSEWELCESCTGKFSFLSDKECCPHCQKPSKDSQVCQDCQYWQERYSQLNFHHEAIFQYNEGFSKWLQEYKILGNYQLRFTFKKHLHQRLKKYRRQGFVICPLPLSKKRFHTRGFNQVSSLLKAADIPIVELLKRADAPPQSLKNRRERLEMPQPFQIDVNPEKILNKKILLVDDVYTTGRTMLYAALILQDYQLQKVMGFSLAR